MTTQRDRLVIALVRAQERLNPGRAIPVEYVEPLADALLARGVRVVDADTLAAALHDQYEPVHYTDTDPDYGHKGRCRACGEEGVWSSDVAAADVLAALD